MIPQMLWSDPALPAGLDVWREFVSPEEEADLVAALDDHGWDDTPMARRVQQYGSLYGFSQRLNGEETREMPGWLVDVCEKLQNRGVMPYADNVIANEYTAGQGIAPHVDSSWFGPHVVTLSLLDSWAMDFTRGYAERHRVLLERRSAVRLGGPARFEWKHSIAHRANDYVFGTLRPRGPRRVSLTFRTIVGENPAKTMENPDDAKEGR